MIFVSFVAHAVIFVPFVASCLHGLVAVVTNDLAAKVTKTLLATKNTKRSKGLR